MAFTPGQKVLAWDAGKASKKVETVFLSELELPLQKFVCTSPETKDYYEKGQKIVIRRYDFIEEIKKTPVPKFRIGDAVVKTLGEYKVYSKITAVSIREKYIVHYYLGGTVEADEDTLALVTDKEYNLYFK